MNDENTDEHLKFFERAWEYNNNISLGIVCVDHGDDGNAYADGERAARKYNWWNPGFGDFCATIQGRTFLMLKKIGNRYGLDWATIGNANGALEKSLAANENLKKVNKDILRSLLQDSFVDNPLVREVVEAHAYLSRANTANLDTHIVEINKRTCVFDVSAIQSEHGGNRSICVKAKDG